MNRFVVWLILAPILTIAGAAETTAPQSAVESSPDRNVFSLLPKAFQKNPLLDQTVITEMTPAGKTVPPPTSDHPAYYIIQSGGRHDEGYHFAEGQPPTEAALHAVIGRVLAAQSYQPAKDGHPPSLMLLYHWGSCSLRENQPEEDADGTETINSDALLAAAKLTGGEKFAQDLFTALREQQNQNQYKESLDRMEAALRATGMDVHLSVPPPEFAQSARAFTNRDDHTRQLIEQTTGNFYYVVVSAYDYTAAASNRRLLLWRTRMTVVANGVAMADSLPALLVSAGKYFGQDMSESALLSRRLSEGRIKLGELEIKEYLPNPAEKKAEEPKRKP